MTTETKTRGKEFAYRLCAVNVKNGFDVPTWDNFPTKCMLVITEVHEAVKTTLRSDYSSTLHEAFSEELADVGNRLIDIIHRLFPTMRWYDIKRDSDKVSIQITRKAAEEAFWPFIADISEAVQFWRTANCSRYTVRTLLAMAWGSLNHVAETFCVDLLGEMEKKVEKNSRRGYLHGKGRSD